MLMNCFYAALFLCYFASYAPGKGYWVLILPPILYNIFFFAGHVTRSFFYSKAVAVVNSQNVGAVMELEKSVKTTVADIIAAVQERCQRRGCT